MDLACPTRTRKFSGVTTYVKEWYDTWTTTITLTTKDM